MNKKKEGCSIHLSHVGTPLGRITLANTDSGLAYVCFPGREDVLSRWLKRNAPDACFIESSNAGHTAEKQLIEYFEGRRKTFDLPLDMTGTVFQREVWNALIDIPYGKTLSYGEVAKIVKKPGSARAIGNAVARNPVSIVVPCHRVIGSDGSLVGFGGGMEAKKELLRLEGCALPGIGKQRRN